MPGIAGIISQRPAEECQRLVDLMIGSMKHESFYNSGTHSVPELGVYAGWVALERSFADGQVFLNASGDVALIFSGECFPERQDSIGAGSRDATSEGSSEHWLVRLYEEHGDRFFEKLNGLFSGLLIDTKRRKAYLFNDRYGIERIYWHQAGPDFYFASEAKALLRVLPELRRFDDEGVAQFLGFGCSLGWRTLFRGVHLLPGGSVWTFQNGVCGKTTYFSPASWESQPTLTAEAFEAEFQEVFRRIVPRYFQSESGLGVALTGGLDSRMIMACRHGTTSKPVCYTFSGEKGTTMDDRLAARVAAVCGLEHRLLRLAPDFFSEFASHADRTVHITDGAFGVLGAHEIYFNRQARQLAPTRLTGVGGGELLRGVSTFKRVGLADELLNPEMRPEVEAAARQFTGGTENPVTFSAFKEIPWNMFGTLAAAGSQIGFRSPFLDNELVALAFQAPPCLRTSSLPALHLIKKNDAALGAIPSDMGYLGKTNGAVGSFNRALAKLTFKLDYFNNEGLPHWLSPFDPLFRRLTSGSSVLGLHKYLHYRSWFRRELAGYVSEVLTDPRTRQSPCWNPPFLDQMAREHTSGRRNHVTEINAVLTLEAVERLLFQEPPRD